MSVPFFSGAHCVVLLDLLNLQVHALVEYESVELAERAVSLSSPAFPDPSAWN